MLQTLTKFVAIIITACLLILIEYKFEVIDYLRFVNSAKSIQGRAIAISSPSELIAVVKKFTPSKTNENQKSRTHFQIEIRRVKNNSVITFLDSLTAGNLTSSLDNSFL